MAIDDEYTITAPNVSSSNAAHSTPLSYSAGSARPGLMLLSTQPPFHRAAENLAAMLVVAEHVEARARGREQHRVARARRVPRDRHRVFHGAGAHDRDAGTRDRRLDQGRVAADEHERARRTHDHGLQRREVLALALAAGDQDDLRAAVRETGERRHGGADVS